MYGFYLLIIIVTAAFVFGISSLVGDKVFNVGERVKDIYTKEDFDEESDDGLESNLFDLIESMYDEKE